MGVVKVRDAIKMIEDNGWYYLRTAGSHRQYKHPKKPGRVTIAGHPGDEVAHKTLKSIRQQAGLEK